MSTAIDKVNGTEVSATSTAEAWARAGIADAEAEAIRARTAAEIEERRIKAQAEAEAIRIKAAEEVEKQRIANERQRMALEEKQAAHAKKMAAEKAERDEIERKAAAEAADAKAAEEAKKTEAEAVDEASDRWRKYALGFYIVCAIVALPVQVAAFWNPKAPWLIVAPLMLEGGAWVVLKGAAAAVASRRPHWHYRLIAWVLAFIAAGVNLWHGLEAFDPATAIGTAFASVAGPGVWDLHEHGRIRKRDGVLTRSQRRAQRKAEKAAAAEKAKREALAKADREAAEKAEAEAAKKLAATRAEGFPKVWMHALKLAAALGETTVTEAVWKRAHLDIEGTEPGDSVDIIRGRNIAARRVVAARSEAPGSDPVKATKGQRASQMPPSPGKRQYKPPVRAGRRRAGDTQKYVAAARAQAAIAAREAAKKEPK
ncbi:hypothetical protein ACIQKB_04110 [Streptomyces sp. NPDC092046]|uniref:hypothetical protein n=1 Tax=Streptomyces sp. NPDC092046 TaxID=3366009 RepID=UPI0038115771